jgi:N-acetylmuramoyl-L-alanine amidase
MVALDDLADVFGFQIAPDERENTATATFNGNVIILTEDQQLVSVAGRLVSLRTAPRRADDQWLVPLDFINRALAPFLDQTLEVRQRSRMVLIGDVQVPRVVGQYRAEDDGGRLTFEVTPRTPLTVVQDGGRIVVRFEADALDVEREPGIRGDLVSRVLVHPSAAELLVDLGPAFSAFNVSSRPVPNDSTEVIIDLTAAPRAVDADPETPADPEAPAASPFPAAPVDSLPDLRMPPTVRVVALDAGHGGGDDGTRGSDGTLEKDITLSVTRRLRDAIEQRLGLRVILTRGRDDAIPLDQRAAVANNNKADLFVSLHVNTSIRPSATGAEVFYLSMDEYGAEARELAQREGQRVPVIGGGFRAIDLVEWDMAQFRYLDRSARLAGIVHEELGRRVPLSTRGVQEAPFRVLVGANMPAVLVEMGFISNPEDEQRLSSARFQNAVVDALVDSILRFRRYVESAGEPQVGSRPSATQVRDE